MKFRDAVFVGFGAVALLVQQGARAENFASDTQLFLTGKVDHHSDLAALRVIGDDDRVAANMQPRSARNLAYVDDEIRLGWRSGNWTWSAVNRAFAQLDVNDQALDIFSRVQLGRNPATDQSWQATGRFKSFQGSGLSVRFTDPQTRQWHVEAEGLKLDSWRAIDFSGALNFQARNQSFAFNAQSNRLDERHKFPFMTSVAKTGWAFLLNGGWTSQLGNWQLVAEVRDVGWLRWSGIPRQFQEVNTATRSYDANGYLIYQPLLRGRYEQTDYSEWLSGRWFGSARWQSPDSRWDGAVGFQTLNGLAFLPWLDAGYSSPWGRGAARWDFQQKRLSVSWGLRGVQLSLGADRLGANAKSAFVQAMGAITF